MRELSFNTRRIIVGIATVVALLCLANYLFDLHAFGAFDKKVLVASFAMLWLVVHFLGPTPGETREYREKQRRARNADS